jgi:hypothetical protein
LSELEPGIASHPLTSFNRETADRRRLYDRTNAFRVATIVKVKPSGAYVSRFSPGGIADVAFKTQLFNIVVPSFLTLINLPYSLDRFVFSHFARTQSACDALMEPPSMQLPARCAHAVKTVALSIVYMPIVPVSPILGALAIALSCVFSNCCVPYLPLHGVLEGSYRE